MLNELSKNQYVKISKSKDNTNNDVEYGVVINKEGSEYDIMSIGFENKNGNFLSYPMEIDNLVQRYTTEDAVFDEVKENNVRRKMDIWMEKNHLNKI